MFADVLTELFLGVLAEHRPQPWFDTAVDWLSRGAAPKLWASLSVAHAAGLRIDPRAVAQAEAINLLCQPHPKPSDVSDFPTEFTALVVTRDVSNAVHARTRNGVYTSPDEVVECALHALEWAENDPEGKRRLLRFALLAGVADEESGKLIPAEVVFARLRERTGAPFETLPSRSDRAIIPPDSAGSG
jgi:hypothetical protein